MHSNDMHQCNVKIYLSYLMTVVSQTQLSKKLFLEHDYYDQVWLTVYDCGSSILLDKTWTYAG